jgi:hypothetical protein
MYIVIHLKSLREGTAQPGVLHVNDAEKEEEEFVQPTLGR